MREDEDYRTGAKRSRGQVRLKPSGRSIEHSDLCVLRGAFMKS